MRITPYLLATVLAAGTVGCSSSDDHDAAPNPSPAPSQGTSAPGATATATTPAATTGGTVHQLKAETGFRFSPASLTLKVGDSVKVVDTDPDVPHNWVVTNVGRSPTLSEGDTYTLKFDRAGVFDFVCTFHEAQGMGGMITVA